jgi:uncharacterized lipoprotein
MSFERALLAIAAGTLLSACHIFHRVAECHRPQEYQRARQMPPLKVPAGLDAPNTQGALVIPTVDLTPPPPGPHDACLDTPPRYKPAPPNKAGSGSG